MMASLTRGQVEKVKQALSIHRLKLPKVGWVENIPLEERARLKASLGTHYPPRRIARDHSGYYLVF
jgi:hypothetical protein